MAAAGQAFGLTRAAPGIIINSEQPDYASEQWEMVKRIRSIKLP